MQVLPKEDILEAFQIHFPVDFLVLGKSFVLIEHLHPVAVGQRRKNSHYRAPIDHRQTGTGQTSDSPDYQDHDHTEANAS